MIRVSILVGVVLTPIIVATAYWSAAQASSRAAEVLKVEIDSGGRIHITDSAGKEVIPPEDKDQANCSSPKVAQDKHTVGWLAEYANAGNSYPLPLALVIYRKGKIIQQISPGQSIWDWQFIKTGSQVAFWIGPTHGEFVPHFELHDVRSGKLMAQWDGHLEQAHPSWVDGLKE
ncbi:MAG TPA: hypothetical protein VEF05_04080 [Terriglobales bacterium]|nr:hypothetical protein [Terriglobales bacterium]